MKKATLFFIGAFLIGISSAFTTQPENTTALVKNPGNSLQYIEVDMIYKGDFSNPNGWDCSSGADTCLFSKKSGVFHSAPYSRSEVVPNINTIDEQFYWY